MKIVEFALNSMWRAVFMFPEGFHMYVISRTNQQNEPFFMMVIKATNGQTHMSIISILHSKKRTSMISTTLSSKSFYGKEASQHNQFIFTDEDSTEY